MLTQITCPDCGAERGEAEGACPKCGGGESSSPSSDAAIAHWLADTPGTPQETPAATAIAAASTRREDAWDPQCLACGYQGPMVGGIDGDGVYCPACTTSWRDRRVVILKTACPDCGQVLLLTEEDREKSIVCPNCRVWLGCLVDRDRKGLGARSSLFHFLIAALALAPGFGANLLIQDDRVPWGFGYGMSMFALPLSWSVVVLRILGAGRSRRRSQPPGIAACLAVIAASTWNLFYDKDLAFMPATFPLSLISRIALHAVQPLSIAAAVGAVWMLLACERRWKPERSWTDLLGRLLGAYWLAAAAVVAIVKFFGS